MTMYKAIVTDKMNGRRVVIESEHNTKAEFIHDLRANGYAVNPSKVKTKDVFDYIMKHTDCAPWDWKETKSIPVKLPKNIDGKIDKLNTLLEQAYCLKSEIESWAEQKGCDTSDMEWHEHVVDGCSAVSGICKDGLSEYIENFI